LLFEGIGSLFEASTASVDRERRPRASTAGVDRERRPLS
jgi:hypothetical protein